MILDKTVLARESMAKSNLPHKGHCQLFGAGTATNGTWKSEGSSPTGLRCLYTVLKLILGLRVERSVIYIVETTLFERCHAQHCECDGTYCVTASLLYTPEIRSMCIRLAASSLVTTRIPSSLCSRTEHLEQKSESFVFRLRCSTTSAGTMLQDCG